MAQRTDPPLSTSLLLVALMLGAPVLPGVAYAAEVVPPEPVLSVHNRVRDQHGLPPLRWSTRLAEDAAAWAEHLAEEESCRMVHGETEQGENLFWASPLRWSDGRTAVQPVAPEAVVRRWAAEQDDYDYAENICRGEQCGHYTQIVWEQTEQVGCAKRVCQDLSQVWVCRYYPAGNIIGEKPY